MAMEELIKDINFDEELGRLRHAQSSQSSCDSHGYHEPLEPLEVSGGSLDLGIVRTFAPWKILVTLSLVSMGSMAALCAHAKVAGAAPAAVEETVDLGTWSDSIEGCTRMFQAVMDHDVSEVQLGDFNFQSAKVTLERLPSAKKAAEALRDPRTDFVQIGRCQPEDRSVVWLYPDKSGDESSAFLLADGECKRIETQALDKTSKASCVAVYRVPSPSAGTILLNHFHQPGTISHAVLGGHGSDNTWNQGVLQMSGEVNLGEDDVESTTLVDTLGTKLTPHGTVFLDSCFAGINGVAQMVSKRLPQHWVMGGVVSLNSFIRVQQTPFDGSAQSGPTQVTSELAPDSVIDPSKGVHDDDGYPEASFLEGVALQGDGTVEKVDQLVGERIIAWFGGINRGSVTQWLYPSKNDQVLKIGCKVQVVEPFHAFRMGSTDFNMDEPEKSRDDQGLGIFSQLLPKGLEGSVLFLHDVGNAPTSGNALINYGLPQEFKEAGITGGAGQTLGPLLTLTQDFGKLKVHCP